MAGPSSISSALSNARSQDQEAADLKILFGPSFNIQIADLDLLNKYVIYKFNQYATVNTKDYSLWDSIEMDFAKFEAKNFDELDSATWKVIKEYCYPHGFWIDPNNGSGRTRTAAMLKAIEDNWNNEWTLEQIKWVVLQCKGHDHRI